MDNTSFLFIFPQLPYRYILLVGHWRTSTYSGKSICEPQRLPIPAVDRPQYRGQADRRALKKDARVDPGRQEIRSGGRPLVGRGAA